MGNQQQSLQKNFDDTMANLSKNIEKEMKIQRESIQQLCKQPQENMDLEAEINANNNKILEAQIKIMTNQEADDERKKLIADEQFKKYCALSFEQQLYSIVKYGLKEPTKQRVGIISLNIGTDYTAICIRINVALQTERVESFSIHKLFHFYQDVNPEYRFIYMFDKFFLDLPEDFQKADTNQGATYYQLQKICGYIFQNEEFRKDVSFQFAQRSLDKYIDWKRFAIRRQ